ncbi:MAG: hypothetical protein IPF48_04135 [Sphingomonadales bacterium]|nr:hypothetical protein [Sphingomonadales bacterium]
MFIQLPKPLSSQIVALTGLAASPVSFAHDRYERGDYYNDGYRGDSDGRHEATAGHASAAITTTATTTITARLS